MNPNLLQKLLAYYEVSRGTVMLDADIFLSCLKILDERGHSLGAVSAGSPAIWHLPFPHLQRRYPRRAQLAVACYLWAIEQVVARRKLVSLRWVENFGSCAATPFRVSRFESARVVIDAEAAAA